MSEKAIFYISQVTELKEYRFSLVHLFCSLKYLEASEKLPSLRNSNDASIAVSLQEGLRHGGGMPQSTGALKSLLNPAQALAGSQLEGSCEASSELS